MSDSRFNPLVAVKRDERLVLLRIRSTSTAEKLKAEEVRALIEALQAGLDRLDQG